MEFTRNLRYGDKGEDVFFIKKCLFELGQYSKSIKEIKSKTFRSDTKKAVKLYQRSHIDTNGRPLDVDGIIGKLTWNAIMRDYNNKVSAQGNTSKPNENASNSAITPQKPTNITRITQNEFPNLAPQTINLLNQAWAGISEARVEFCKLFLAHAYDQNRGGKIKGLYVWGDNLYNKDLKLNKPTVSHIEKKASGEDAKYFTEGRKEMMIAAINENPNLASADCSGAIVGVARVIGYIKANADARANGLCGSGYSKSINREALQPGDFVGYSGHIGLYLGKGMVVEAAGGAYGIQITDIDTRLRYDFVSDRFVKGTAWSRFRRPKWY